MRRAARLMFVLTVALFALSLSPVAEAQGRGGRGGHGGGRGGGDRPRPRAAPEFDPAAAGAIATLLAGAGVVAARRKR
jgi:hypothetical protein